MDFENKKSLRDRTYFNTDLFIADLRENSLFEHFVITEDVFRIMMSEIVLNKSVSELIRSKGVVLLMHADNGREIDGLIAMAGTMAGENGG